jgi:hypothetical protein
MRYRLDDGQFADTTLDRLAAGDVIAGDMPVRELRSYQGRGQYSSWCWSSTTGRHIAYEIRLELARLARACIPNACGTAPRRV